MQSTIFHGLLSGSFFNMWFDGNISHTGLNTTVCGEPIECSYRSLKKLGTDVLSAALDAGTAVGLILIYFWFALSLVSWYPHINFLNTVWNTH